MKRLIPVLAFVLLVSGCAAQPAPAPVVSAPTQAPTWTVQPTLTPRPTYTPFPTWTIQPTIAATPTLVPTATPAAASYTVQRGDTLTLIAKRFNVDPAVLLAANGIANADLVPVGQILIIPSAGTTVTVAPTQVIARATAPAAPRPTQPPAAPAPAVASNFVYPQPKILYPDNSATLKYSKNGKDGGTDDITFAWLPVGELQGGTEPCHWADQPNGTHAYIVDRYQIEFNPGVPDWAGKLRPIMNNDHGVNRTFSLLEFKPNVSYTWRVVVARYCVAKDYDQFSNKHQALLGLASPYTESRTFMYTLP